MTGTPEKLRFELSVHDVVALASAGSSRPVGAPLSRARLGQEAHTRYQQETAARPGFRKEVSVSVEAPARGLLLAIDGRIDAVVTEQNLTVIEEIKSVFVTSREAARLDPAELTDWANQARLYQWMWEKSGLGPARSRLVLASLLDGGWHAIDLIETGDALDRHVQSMLDRAAGRLEHDLEIAEQRRALVPRLQFPFEDYRPHQQDLETAAGQAVKSGSVLIAEAPTGLGKTAAVLAGALRTVLSQNRKLYFLTAKGTQQKMALETLEKIRDQSGFGTADPLRIVQIRAKEKMCLNDVMVCDPEFCPYLKDFPERLEKTGTGTALMQKGVVTGDDLLEIGRAQTLCPFEMSLEMAWQSEAVTCDYNYAFDPDVMLWELADPDLAGQSVLVVDEAHALPSRARGYRSPVLEAAELEKLAGLVLSPSIDEPVKNRRGKVMSAGLFDTPVERLVRSPAARELSRELLNAARIVKNPDLCGVTDPGQRGTYRARPEPEQFEKIRARMERLFLDYLVEKKREGVTRPHDPAAEGFMLVSKFARTLMAAGDETEALWTPEFGAKLSLHCLDASRFLASNWSSAGAAILMSATLSPDDYFHTTLGLPATATRLTFPSPFPAENLTVEIESDISTAFRDRTKSLQPLAHRLREFLEKPGNRAVFAPSFDYLSHIHDAVGPLPGKRYLIQGDRMNDADREFFFRELTAGTGDIVLWAVLGGIFAEGIDLPGDHLIGAAIIGPGLPKPDPERELEKTYWDDRMHGSGFDYAYLYPGMIRVIQSAGRLIRSETDTGELLLIDKRFAQPGYRKLFPEWWRV